MEKKPSNAGGVFVVVKLGLSLSAKVLPVVAKLLKSLTAGKAFLAIASLGIYSYLFTWQFALMLLIMIGFHEAGHVWAMKRLGIPTKGFYFIPLLGGVALAEKEADTHEGNYYIAIMGPIWGMAIAILTATIYFITGDPLFAAGASWMALVNAFNLLPIHPMDGGRIIKAIGASVHSAVGVVVTYGSIIVCAIAAVYLNSSLFGFLLIISLMEIFPLGKFLHYMSQFLIARIIGYILFGIALIIASPIYLPYLGFKWIWNKIIARSKASEEIEDESVDEDDDDSNVIDEPSSITSIERNPIEIAKMSTRKIVFGMAGYVIITGGLVALMYIMEHAPGADAAMHVLFDR